MFSILQYSKEKTRLFILEEIICSLQTRNKFHNSENYAVFEEKDFVVLRTDKHALMWLTPRKKTFGK